MRLARPFLFLVVLALAAVAALKGTIELVPPSRIGVKQNLWGGGVVEKDYPVGFHVGVTGVHKWHLLDRRTHFLTFSDSDEGTGGVNDRPALVIRTKDNNTATFDLSLTYRIVPGKAHRMVQEGLKDVYRERVFTTVESVMREELAQLSSEDIYSTEKRLEVVRSSLPKLAQELAAFFVVPDQILIRAVNFTDAYERKLQEKQLTYQQRLLATANERVERQRAITETRNAEIEAAEKDLRGDWNKRLETLRAANEVEIAGIDAEARIYDVGKRASADADYETLVAEGRLAVAQSEALRDELRNQALDTVGGRIYLAQQAARNVQFEQVTLNSNDPDVPSVLDLDELVRLLIGSEP